MGTGPIIWVLGSVNGGHNFVRLLLRIVFGLKDQSSIGLINNSISCCRIFNHHIDGCLNSGI